MEQDFKQQKIQELKKKFNLNDEEALNFYKAMEIASEEKPAKYNEPTHPDVEKQLRALVGR